MPAAQQTPTLAQLFEKIQLWDSDGNRCRFRTLADLLWRGRKSDDARKDLKDVKHACAFSWDQYCGVGAFHVPARRLVDLWMELSQLAAEFEKPSAVNLERYKELSRRVRDVCQKQWHRIIDADPTLSPDMRNLLQLRGPRGLNLGDLKDVQIEHVLMIKPPIQAGKHSGSNYQARVHLLANVPGSGIPVIASNPETSSTMNPSVETRCAYVLYHDLDVLCDEQRQPTSMWPQLSSTFPVVISWEGPQGHITTFSWPLPPLTTFVEMSQFLERWRTASGKVLSSAPSDGWEVLADTVTELVRLWVGLGVQSIENSLPESESQKWLPGDSWEQIASHLDSLGKWAAKTKNMRAADQVAYWHRQFIHLAQPEFCSFAGNAALVREIESSDTNGVVKSATKEVHELLSAERRARLSGLLENNRAFWVALNTFDEKDSWVCLPLSDVTAEETQAVIKRLDAMNQSIQNLQNEFRSSELQSLWWRADAASESDPALANLFLRQACEVANRRFEANPHDQALRFDWSLALLRVSQNLASRGLISEARESCETSLNNVNTIVNKNTDNDLYVSTLVRALCLKEELDRAEGDLRSAVSSIDRAKSILQEFDVRMKLNKELLFANANVKSLHALLLIYSNQSGEAISECLSAEKDYEELADSIDDRKGFGLKKSLNQYLMGEIFYASKEFKNAQERYNAAIAMLGDQFSEYSRSTLYVDTNARCLTRVGDCFLHLRDFSRAMRKYSDAHRHRRELAKLDANGRRAKWDVATLTTKLGIVHVEMSKVPSTSEHQRKSIVYLRRAIRMFEALRRESPKILRLQREHAIACAWLAEALGPNGAEAGERRRQAWDLLEVQDVRFVRVDPDLQAIYESLKAEFDQEGAPAGRRGRKRKE